jgi:hypothetical protein
MQPWVTIRETPGGGSEAEITASASDESWSVTLMVDGSELPERQEASVTLADRATLGHGTVSAAGGVAATSGALRVSFAGKGVSIETEDASPPETNARVEATSFVLDCNVIDDEAQVGSPSGVAISYRGDPDMTTRFCRRFTGLRD